MTTNDATQDWYEGFGGWDASTLTGGALRPLLAELVGATVAGAEADQTVWWHGGSSHASYDVVADKGMSSQVRSDIKRSWIHDADTLGFGGPGKRGDFNPAAVDLIVLVLLEPAGVTVDLGFDPDGTVTMTASGKPVAIYQVPAEKLNGIMRRDGRSVARWLVSFDDAEEYLVRGARPAASAPRDGGSAL